MGRDDDAYGGSACLVITVALNIGVRFDYPPAVAVLSRVALFSVGCLYDNAGTLADSMK